MREMEHSWRHPEEEENMKNFPFAPAPVRMKLLLEIFSQQKSERKLIVKNRIRRIL